MLCKYDIINTQTDFFVNKKCYVMHQEIVPNQWTGLMD